MTKKKEHIIKSETLKTIPANTWNSPLRKGTFKLYAGESVIVSGFRLYNTTKQLIKLQSGEAIPEGVKVQKVN